MLNYLAGHAADVGTVSGDEQAGKALIVLIVIAIIIGIVGGGKPKK